MTDRTPSTAAERVQRYSLAIDPDDSCYLEDTDDSCYLELDPDGHWCVADEAEDLIAEAHAPLDVERLARAFWSVTRERFAASPLVPDLPEWRDPSIDAATWDKSVSDAAEVAREYAKEPQP